MCATVDELAFNNMTTELDVKVKARQSPIR